MNGNQVYFEIGKVAAKVAEKNKATDRRTYDYVRQECDYQRDKLRSNEE